MKQDVRKKYEVPVEVACRYLTGDQEVKIYLTPMRKKRRIPLRMRLRLKRYLKKAFLYLMTMGIMVPASIFLINAAYLTRGYWAVGGEYLLIGVLAVAVYYALSHLFR